MSKSLFARRLRKQELLKAKKRYLYKSNDRVLTVSSAQVVRFMTKGFIGARWNCAVIPIETGRN